MSLFTMLFGQTGRERPVSQHAGEYSIAAKSANTVARRFARGNIAAQFGRILTAERMEEERACLRRLLERQS